MKNNSGTGTHRYAHLESIHRRRFVQVFRIFLCHGIPERRVSRNYTKSPTERQIERERDLRRFLDLVFVSLFPPALHRFSVGKRCLVSRFGTQYRDISFTGKRRSSFKYFRNNVGPRGWVDGDRGNNGDMSQCFGPFVQLSPLWIGKLTMGHGSNDVLLQVVYLQTRRSSPPHRRRSSILETISTAFSDT